MPLKVLITGQKGYLGQCLMKHLSQQPDIQAESVNCRLQALEPHSLAFDRVIHCSARRPGPTVTRDQLHQDNHGATQALITALRQPTPIVYLSSSQVYGPHTPGHLWTETEPAQPDTAYGLSKLAAEKALQASQHKVSILRVGTLFGWGLAQTGRGFLDQAASMLLQGQVLNLYRTDSERSYLYVWDLVACLSRLLVQSPDQWPTCLNVTGPSRSVHGLIEGLLAAAPDAILAACRYENLSTPASFVRVSERLWQDWCQKNDFKLSSDQLVFQRLWQALGGEGQ